MIPAFGFMGSTVEPPSGTSVALASRGPDGPSQDAIARDGGQLPQIQENFPAAELRRAELAVAKGVWHLHCRLVPAARDHLEADLEADRVYGNAFEHRASQREEPRRAVADRHERVPDEASGARDDAAAERPVERRAAGHVAASDREVGSGRDRVEEKGDDLWRVGEIRVHDHGDVASRLAEAGEH